MAEDDPITSVRCSGCGSLIRADSATCATCDRKFTPRQLQVHKRRISSSISFGDRARELSERLEERRGELYRRLAVEGRALEVTFENWTKSPPPDEERVKSINELAAWSRRALDALTEER